ncbi:MULTISPECIES: DMT family transporter [Streptomyces]|uniref:DMT family transporter n=2 Tax=Streptomyces TaxID=1883 RepID=UPI00332F6165
MTGTAGRGAAPVGAASACVLLASVLWGTTGTAATLAPDVGPLAIGAVAMGLGGLLQAVVAAPRIRREAPLLRAQRGVVLLGAVAVAAYPPAFYSSMHLAGVATGTVVSIGSAPLASALIERVVDGRRLTRRWITGAVLGLSGTVLLCAAEATAGTSSGPGARSAGSTVLGVALGLTAGLTYAVYSWAAHRLIGRGLTSGAAMGTVFGIGGLLLVPVLPATGAPLLDSWSAAAVGAYMALVPMFLGYVLFGWGLARVGASTATTLTLLEPAVAAVLAVLVVGERLRPAGWAGVALIVCCLGVLTVPFPGAAGRRAATPPRPLPPVEEDADVSVPHRAPAGEHVRAEGH